MRLSTQQFFLQNLDTVSRGNAELFKVQQQLASGKKVQQPSDDPLAMTQIIKFDRVIARTEQFADNITVAERRLSNEESTIDSVVTGLQRVQEIGIRGGNASLSENDRNILAGELGEILDHLTSLLNTQDAQGEYMFAGYKGGTQPYVLNSAGDGYLYQGDAGERFLEIGENTRIQATDPGSSFFGDSDDNVLNAIQDLKDGLESGTDVATVSGEVSDWYENIVTKQAELGSRLRVLDDQANTLTDLKAFTETSRSRFADTDYYEAISQLTLESTALQAAYQSFGKIQQLSLFNYVG